MHTVQRVYVRLLQSDSDEEVVSTRTPCIDGTYK